MTPAGRIDARRLAVLVVRGGRLPGGGARAVEAASGHALLVGDGTGEAARLLAGSWAGPGRLRCWAAETSDPPEAGSLSVRLAPLLAGVEVLLLPGSPDGRDLGPRLAHATGAAFAGGVVRVDDAGDGLEVTLARHDDRVEQRARIGRPAVLVLWGGRPLREGGDEGPAAEVTDVALAGDAPALGGRVEPVGLVAPDPATVDLAEATRVFGGGAGLVPRGASDDLARRIFALLGAVAEHHGASLGATRVVTDAGWLGHDRQIGTTGVSLRPELYVAFGVSGAAQHVGGIGQPSAVASVNTDPSCPMTAMAHLGVTADALGTLVALADRDGIPVDAEVRAATKEHDHA